MNYSKYSLVHAVTSAIVLMVAAPAIAEVQAPNAGSILQQKKSESRDLEAPQSGLQPAGVLKSEPLKQPRYALKRFEFVGNTKVSSEELGLAVQPYIGREVTGLQMEQIAEVISAVYSVHGYGFTSTTYDPVALVQGSAEFSIVEGKAGKVVVNNQSRANDWLVEGLLERFHNNPDNTEILERAGLLINDIPGASVGASRLSRGSVDGTVDVAVDVKSTPLFSGYASIDNYGSRNSGRTRMSAMLGVNSPFGWGDSLRLNVSGTPFHSDGKSTLGGAVYDFPLSNGGLRGGVGYNRLKYNLGGVYTGLFDGTADVWSAYASYPFIRQQATNLSGQLTYSHSIYLDNQVGFENRRHSDAMALMVSGDHQDMLFERNGVNKFAFTLTHGKLQYDSQTFALQDKAGSKTAGDYSKAELALSRMQQLTGSTYLQAELQGQQGFKNLDGASRMVLGGPSGVRAFSSDYLSVDSGILFRGTAGWRLPLGLPVTVYTFYDAAAGALRHTPLRGVANNVSLQGAGVGVDVSYHNIRASVSTATRVGGEALDIQGQPKNWTWASLTYSY
ncbi:hemolysin activation/secretion protein [Pseudomonas sp. TE36184]